MADNFLQAINTGINLGHMADNARMQRAQIERMAATLQMEALKNQIEIGKYAEGQRQQQAIKTAFAPATTVPGGDEYTGPMDQTVMGPGREQLQAVPFGNLAADLMYSGAMQPKDLHAWIPKPEKEGKQSLITSTGPDGKPVRVPDAPGVTPYEKQTPTRISTVDLGDTVEVYENGVKVRTEPKGKSPGSEGVGKPQQSQFTDPATGLPLIFDPKTGTYSVSTVHGGGGIQPRPVNPSATERERTGAFAVLRDQLERIKHSYNSKYVGLVSGQLGRVTQWNDADEAAFRQIILDVKDSLLRARSGAQINEQEYARLAKLVPDFTDSEAQFSGKMTSFEATLGAIAREREKAQQRGGVQLRGTTSQQPSPSTGAPIPQAAIDFLKKNPTQAIYFDQKYGKGASKRYIGGK